jgi:hypothetical protein
MGLFSSAHDYNHPDMERPLASHSIRLSLFFYISPMTLQGAGCFAAVSLLTLVWLARNKQKGD